LLFILTPLLLADDVPQAVKALEHLKPRSSSGPVAWTAGSYHYDGAGNIAAIGSEAYVYDKLGRLKSATVRGPDMSSLQTQTFVYDDYGNLTSTSKLGQTIILPTSASTNRLNTVSYDASGNVVTAGTQQFGYDAVGMLSTMHLGTNLQPRIVYAYTADDERLFAYDVSTGTTHWTLRGFDSKVLRDFKQVGSNWSVERDYIYRDGLLLAALKSGGAVEHYTLDHLGTPRLITDGAGHRVGYHAYWPFGEEWSPGNAQEGAPLKFTGHERDADPSGGSSPLDYMHARYYQAAWGRFLAVDPVLGRPAAPQSWNRYSYALNNPALHTDPNGRCLWDGCVAEAVGVAAVAYTAVVRYEIFLRSPNSDDPSRTNRQVAADNIRAAERTVASALDKLAHVVTSSDTANPPGTYRPPRKLPNDPRTGNPALDQDVVGPHTQLGTKKSSRTGQDYTQGREVDANGKKVKDVDFTDHGEPDKHPNPHEHVYDGETGARGSAQPLNGGENQTPQPPH
jgi:RHS repeat-associated protein